MQKTSIEWCTHTVNPIRARHRDTGKRGHYCEKISPGCKNCYASALQGPYFGMPPFNEQRMLPGSIEPYLEERELQAVLRRREPARIFWCDMSDLFGDWVRLEWQDACLATMMLTPQHTHLLLTKRANIMRDYAVGTVGADRFSDLNDHARRIDPHGRVVLPTQRHGMVSGTWPPPNVWWGASVESRPYLARLDVLREIPSPNLYVSFEPLLEHLGAIDLSGIGWVIVGGESGHAARPMHPDWARGIRDQCVAAGVPFLFKQWGAWQAFYDRDRDDPDWQRCPKLKAPHERWMNITSGHGFHGDRIVAMRKVGKKAAGRLLDGHTWDELPPVRDAEQRA